MSTPNLNKRQIPNIRYPDLGIVSADWNYFFHRINHGIRCILHEIMPGISAERKYLGIVQICPHFPMLWCAHQLYCVHFGCVEVMTVGHADSPDSRHRLESGDISCGGGGLRPRWCPFAPMALLQSKPQSPRELHWPLLVKVEEIPPSGLPCSGFRNKIGGSSRSRLNRFG